MARHWAAPTSSLSLGLMPAARHSAASRRARESSARRNASSRLGSVRPRRSSTAAMAVATSAAPIRARKTMVAGGKELKHSVQRAASREKNWRGATHTSHIGPVWPGAQYPPPPPSTSRRRPRSAAWPPTHGEWPWASRQRTSERVEMEARQYPGASERLAPVEFHAHTAPSNAAQVVQVAHASAAATASLPFAVLL